MPRLVCFSLSRHSSASPSCSVPERCSIAHPALRNLRGAFVVLHREMRRRVLRILVILLVTPPLTAALAGWLVAPAYLHPIRRELSPDLIRGADATFAEI